ncbi:protein transport protein sec24-like [Theileria orientalis]|uniref:Protein transport protein sec24-like n=1 Tax=Theileria orientalis TaxID=68886 RepID=A0A976M9C6_THEOR|nr:protein transport protein sec24-like [Theileria orientalis]
MASNRPNDRPGYTGRATNPFPNSQNQVHQTPFANIVPPHSQSAPSLPYPPGSYGQQMTQAPPGQFYPPSASQAPPPPPPPMGTGQPAVVNRAGAQANTYANPPSVHFTASLDYTSQVPPAFSEPVPPPKMDELGQQVQGAGTARPVTKTAAGQVFHENLSATTVGFKSDDSVLDSVVLMNTTKNFVSLSVETLPATDQLYQKSNLTLSYTIAPLNRVEDVPLINYGSEPIMRCKSCRAYINPFVRTDPSKRFWLCNLCETSNELQGKYLAAFNHFYGSNHNGGNSEVDYELKCGVVEYIASADYTVRPPQPPVYLFLIDVSANAVNSRMLEMVCTTIKELILEGGFGSEDRTMVGIMTFDTSVHFYQISQGMDNFQLLIVSDLEDLFLPLPGDIVVNLEDSSQELLKLLESLPLLWKDTTVNGSSMGSAIRSAHYAMKHVGGKLVVFTSSPCMYGDFSMTAAQKAATEPQTSTVLSLNKKPVTKVQPVEKCKDFSATMSQTQTSLDLFVCTPQQLNLEKLRFFATLTSGNIYYYPYKHHSENRKLVEELRHLVTRTTVWESVMRIRLSKGWKVTNWFGNCFLRGSDLMVLPTTSEDHTYTITFAPDASSGPTNSNAAATRKVMYIQTALLHTNSYGERRIRVFNTAVPVSNDLGTVLNSVNVEALVYNMLLGAIKVNYTSGKLVDARSFLTGSCSRVTSSMSILGSTADAVRVLALYVLGLLKSSMFTEEHNHDLRVYLSTKFRSCKIDQVILYAYPQLYNLTNELNAQELLLQGLPLALDSLVQECCYLLFNGEYVLLWVGKNVPNNFMQATFDVPSFEQLNVALVPHALEQMSTPNAHKLRMALEMLRERLPPYVPLMVLKQNEADGLFYANLIQDKTQGMMVTFQEFFNSVQPRSTIQLNR